MSDVQIIVGNFFLPRDEGELFIGIVIEFIYTRPSSKAGY